MNEDAETMADAEYYYVGHLLGRYSAKPLKLGSAVVQQLKRRDGKSYPYLRLLEGLRDGCAIAIRDDK